MLEPVDEVTVLVADEYVGAVMSDLSSRRGRVGGTEPVVLILPFLGKNP